MALVHVAPPPPQCDETHLTAMMVSAIMGLVVIATPAHDALI